MSPKNLAFVGCRLLAVYFLFATLQSLPHNLLTAAGVLASDQLQPPNQFFHQASEWLTLAWPIVSLAMVLLLWLGAGWLSREIAEGAPATVPDWSPQSLLSVGTVLVGLILASFALPPFVLNLVYIADGATEAGTFQVYLVVSQFAQILFGLALILGSQQIARTIAGLRRWSAERS